MTGSSPALSLDVVVPVPGPSSARVRGVAGEVVVMPKRGLQLPRQLSFERWVGVGRRLSDVYTSSAWCLGDWLVYGEAAYRGRYREAAEQTSLDYQTLRNYAWVAKRFALSRRRERLSFGHHAEVAALPEAEQDFWLRKAEELGWQVKRLRHEIRASLTERAAGQSASQPAGSVPGSRASGLPRIRAGAGGTDDRAQRTSAVSAATADTSAGVEGYTGWILLSRRGLHVMEAEMAAGAQGRRHLHPNTTQVYYILAGDAIVEMGSTSVTASAGQAIEIGPGDPHQISNETDIILRFLVISSGPPPKEREDLP